MKILIIPFILCLISSCMQNHGNCEAFDLSLLQIKDSFWYKEMKFSNGKTTMIWKKQKSEISKDKGPIFMYGCFPRYGIIYKTNSTIFNEINYEFEYDFFDKTNSLELSLILDGNIINLDIDSLKKKNQLFNSINITKTDESNLIYNRIKSIQIEKYQIKKIEMVNGEVWNFIEGKK